MNLRLIEDETEATLADKMAVGQWYNMSLYGDEKEIYIIEPLAGMIRTLDARGMSPATRQYRAIDMEGGLHDVSALSIDAPGIGGLKLLDKSDILTADDIKALHGKREQAQRKIEQDYKQKEAEKAQQRKELPGRYPHLESFEARKARLGKDASGHALGASNIKRDLKKAFPGIKFEVTSDSFSGGDSIDVRWEYGPTTEAVDKIINKYEEGSFDGMTDCYDYHQDRTFSDVFGGAKYVHSSRSYPHCNGADWFETSIYGAIGREICRLQGVAFESENQHNLCGNNDSRDLRQYVNDILSNTSFPAGFTLEDFAGLECKDEKESHFASPWRVVFKKQETT